MKCYFLLSAFFILSVFTASSQTFLAAGEQPQSTVDSKERVRVVYGDKNKIYYTTSDDKGNTFAKPILVGEVNEMHLGMTRGPQLATSKDYSIVTAMDKAGNIHAFMLTHKTGKWKTIANVNDKNASAPEGLMSVTADGNNNFYAVWLDLRENKKNNIALSVLKGNGSWSKNEFAYKSPEDHVCECCKPSIAVKGAHVYIMFRNWLNGSRDLYVVTSANGGKTFGEAVKLGKGTWPLNACPMDGGGLAIDSKNVVHTAWQRDGQVYYAKPGEQEQRIDEGRHVALNGKLITWESGSDLFFLPLNGKKQKVGEGTAMTMHELNDKSILAIWEKDGQLLSKKITVD